MRGAAIAAWTVALALVLPAAAGAELPTSADGYSWPVAASPAREVLAVDGVDPDLFYRVTPPRGAGGPSRRLTTDGVDPDVAYGPHGEAIAAWSTSAGPKFAPMAAYRPAGGTFQPAVTLAKGGYPRPPLYNTPDPQVAFDGAGVATLAWTSLDGRIVTRTRSVSGRWSTPEQLAGGAKWSAPSLVVAPSGAATITWDRPGPGHGQNQVLVATRPAGGRFGAPVRLVANGEDPGGPLVAENERGDAVVIWSQDRGEAPYDVMSRLYGAFRSGLTGAFGPPVPLSPPAQDASGPSASVAADGAMVIAWRDNGRRRLVAARLRTAAGRLLAPQILTRHLALNTGTTALALGPGIVGWFSGANRKGAPIRLQTARATLAGTFGAHHTWSTARTLDWDTPYLFATNAGLLVVSPHGRVLARRALEPTA
jgi:hypothetical protein